MPKKDVTNIAYIFSLDFTGKYLPIFGIQSYFILRYPFSFPQIFVKIFSSDPALLESTVSMLRIFMLGIFAMGAQMACQQTFVALGQAKVSMFLALLRKIILLIPMAIVLPIFWGVTGILVAEPVADILAATTTVVMFTRFAKKNLKTEPLAEPKAAK